MQYSIAALFAVRKIIREETMKKKNQKMHKQWLSHGLMAAIAASAFVTTGGALAAEVEPRQFPS
jgi:hypothetical protein